MRFADIIGQKRLKEQLAHSVDVGRVSHAQLFTGKEGYGSLAMAVAYAQYLNCPNRKDGDSCGVCPSCRQIAALAHPDVHFIYPVNKQNKKSSEILHSKDFIEKWCDIFTQHSGYFSPTQWNDKLNLGKTMKAIISAADADDIIRILQFKSFESPYKVMIIWRPETMNETSSNRILKILEEPWPKTLFILVSERPDLLMKTIISRTQEVVVPRLKAEDFIVPLQKSGITDSEQINTMARLACGDYLELKLIVGGAEDEIRHENFDYFCRLMRLSYNDRHLELFNWAEEVATLSREHQLSMLIDFARLLRQAFIIHAGLGNISYLWGEEATFCKNFAPFIGSENIENILSEIETARRQIIQNGSPKIVYTHFALAISKQIKHL